MGLPKFIKNNFNFLVNRPFQSYVLSACQMLIHPAVLSISLIVHLAGERAWQLFATSSKITSLIIRGIEPSGNP
jgi:hypothetical protein